MEGLIVSEAGGQPKKVRPHSSAPCAFHRQMRRRGTIQSLLLCAHLHASAFSALRSAAHSPLLHLVQDRAAVKAERAAARGAKQAAPVVAEDDPLSGNYGDVALVQSAAVTDRQWTKVADFGDSHVGQRVLVRGRVHTVRGKGKSAFLILRQGTLTLQVRAQEAVISACGAAP